MRETQLQPREILKTKRRGLVAPCTEAPRSACYTSTPSRAHLGALGRMCNGLGKFAVFRTARSRSYAKLFYKNYSIVFFVHFGHGELYSEMVLQDKLVNPCQANLIELAHLLPSPVGERKKWSAGGMTAGMELERNAARRAGVGSNRSCSK